MNKHDPNSLADEALVAFWQVIVKRLPEAATGDLSPERATRLKLAAATAIEEWIANNISPEPKDPATPTTRQPLLAKNGYRFKLTRQVDRFPDFLTPIGLTGTVTVTEDGIWAKIDQPIPGAEAWDNELYWETVEGFLADTEAIP